MLGGKRHLMQGAHTVEGNGLKKGNVLINAKNTMQWSGEINNQTIIQENVTDCQWVKLLNNYVMVVMAICGIMHFSVNNKAFSNWQRTLL